MLQSLRRDLQPRFLFPSLTVGLLGGIQNAVLALAFAAMIFAADLKDYLAIGATILVVGTIIQSVVVMLGSSLPGMITGVQDSPAAIMMVVAIGILASMGAGAASDEKFYTVLAAIILTTLLTGLACLLLGLFRLGNLVSYIPYPVVAGFLAGTGILLVLGALGVMAGENVTLFNLPLLFKAGVVLRWLPGVIFALLLFELVRRVGHYLVLPAVLLGSVVIFYLVLWVTHTSIAIASAEGYLLGGMPTSGVLWEWWSITGLSKIDWTALAGQVGSLFACAVVCLLSVLLNITALEISTGQDIDLNIELKNTGLANLLSGVIGSIVGYPLLGATSLAYRLGGKIRLNGFFATLVCLAVLLAGGAFLPYFPNFILGGIVFFIGLDFLYSFLYETWFHLPKIDYAIVVAITALINLVGFLPGVGVGLALAVILFVVNYSHTQAVRYTLSGVTYQSTVHRPRLHEQLLLKKGDWLYILELQGFIFFGTANQLLEQVRERLERACDQPPRFIILDFRLVTGIDSSTAFSFTKMKRLAEAKAVGLVLTHLTPAIHRQLEGSELLGEGPKAARIFPDLDHGIEWCEEEMIRTFESVGLAAKPESLLKQLLRALPSQFEVDELNRYLRKQEVPAGECIICQGERTGGLYMIESGQVRVQLACEDGSTLRLRTLGPGAFFGEMGVYSGERASATVVAEEPSVVYRLTTEDLEELEKTEPSLAASLHRFVAGYVSERLAKMTTTVEALLR
jgi:SulP family sulfate permease